MNDKERAVRISDKIYFVTISQTSKRTWVAGGDYMGKRIEVVGSSANNAARRWVDAARCKGDGQSEPPTRARPKRRRTTSAPPF